MHFQKKSTLTLWKVILILEIPRGGGGGVLKVKIVEAKYKAKLEFPGGVGGAKQKTFRGGVWFFF